MDLELLIKLCMILVILSFIYYFMVQQERFLNQRETENNIRYKL